MPAPYPSTPFQLETALLIRLRDAVRWDSALAPVTASGTYSGTLTAPDTETKAFDALDYQRRDRELAWLDTRNAAAVVEVSLEAADVWNASVLRPSLQGPQVGHLTYVPQDVSTTGLTSKVVHVTNASIPVDALQVDRDLAGRDILIYETLYNAVRNLFTAPPITPSGATIVPLTAWSFASGTEARKDVSTALPLNRDLFRDPDMNLADRDNQMAGYVAQLCQILRNPFAFADRLYVGVYGVDSREVETYTLAQEQFITGQRYVEGDEIYHQGSIYRVKTGVGTTIDVPWASPWAWEVVASPRQRIWTTEPALPGRNRFVYDTENLTLQWFREKTDFAHIPQLFALSVPGIFSGQSLATIGQVPERKDGQYWRQKAAHIVPSGGTVSDISGMSNTASFYTTNFLVQPTGASLTTPSYGDIWFPDPATNLHTVILPPGAYRVAALVEPNSTVEIPAGENAQGLFGTLGGATFGGYRKLSWALGLPPTQWSVELDYTNLSGSTDGFRIIADLDGVVVFDDTAPFYFNDSDGNPLANGEIKTSNSFPVIPNGGKQVFSLAWTGGSGDLHIRTLRFESDAYAAGRYHMSGTFAGSVALVDVVGDNRVPGVVAWDFNTRTQATTDFRVNWEKDAQLPIRFLRFDLAQVGTNTPTPNAQGFTSYRNDCLVRAARSAQQSFMESVYSGTEFQTYLSAGSVWDADASDLWMATIEQAEPRLRQMDNVPPDSIREGRHYQVASGSLIYEGWGYAAGKTFVGQTDSVYTWASAGTVNQVGAWQRPRATHCGRPGLAPAGVYFDHGTIAVVYGPEQNVPELVTLQPWMIEAGFYASQPEFWIPPAQ